jgi:Sec-independent protein translocase protein TatA
MFDVSWGETFVVFGVGIYFIGRKDLPRATRFLGTQVGRAVGLLQGARVRADRFTAQSELRQLQNELRSGLRELDAVRSEVAVAVSSQGMVGRNLGSTVSGANRISAGPAAGSAVQTARSLPSGMDAASKSSPAATPPLGASLTAAAAAMHPAAPESIAQVRELAPRSQAVAAVAEEQWQKQGIGFQSRAEQGLGDATGSAMLSNLYQQTLIFDQHDRVVYEQDEVLRSRVEENKLKKKRD